MSTSTTSTASLSEMLRASWTPIKLPSFGKNASKVSMEALRAPMAGAGMGPGQRCCGRYFESIRVMYQEWVEKYTVSKMIWQRLRSDGRMCKGFSPDAATEQSSARGENKAAKSIYSAGRVAGARNPSHPLHVWKIKFWDSRLVVAHQLCTSGTIMRHSRAAGQF